MTFSYKRLLDNALFHRDVNGDLISHDVNPGPAIECKSCSMIRCGKDFTFERYGGEVVQLDRCIYCASKNR